MMSCQCSIIFSHILPDWIALLKGRLLKGPHLTLAWCQRVALQLNAWQVFCKQRHTLTTGQVHCLH